MRRFAVLGLALLLPGCSGVGTYLGDTFTWPGVKPTAPLGNSETLDEANGGAVAVSPMLPQPGDIWPGPPAPIPTLGDIERMNNINPEAPPPAEEPALPAHRQPTPQSSPTAPENNQPPLAPLSPAPPPNLPPPAISSAPPSPGTTVQTPQGPRPVTGSTGSITTVAPPPGSTGQSILIPNGNGTSTLISPNGTVTTVPTPK
jgi:hypothetical protein